MLKKIISTFAVVFGLFAVCTTASMAAGLTHLGQDVGNLVTIRAKAESGTKHGSYEHIWEQVLKDGTVKEFLIPKGYLLVVTDVDWIYVGQLVQGGANILQSEYHLRINANYATIYTSNPHSMIRSFGSGDDVYAVGGHDSLTAGFVLSDVNIQAYMWPQIQPVISPLDEGKNSYVILHGYLISAW